MKRSILKPRPLVGWTLTLLWAATIFWLSSSGDLPGDIGLPFPLDKLAHAAAFGLLALFLQLATGKPWLAVLLASLYGISDELHQALVPGRSSDPWDWGADVLGASATVLLVEFLTQRSRKDSKPLE